MRYFLLSVLFIFPNLIFGQAGSESIDVSTTEGKAQQLYQENIKKDYINDVYIPIDLEDAYVELDRLASPEAIARFKSAPEKAVAEKLHFGLGKWIMVNWNLYEGSRYSHFLRGMGISHPDDMVQFTIVSFYRFKNGTPLELEKRAKEYQTKLLDIQKEKRKNAQEIGRRKRKN